MKQSAIQITKDNESEPDEPAEVEEDPEEVKVWVCRPLSKSTDDLSAVQKESAIEYH